ncbi:hypothetical protein [Arcobacter porcinus]|uniref:Uncharacterized protein n=1 Tax=Arcobacter porcinus TaxID=1935204 RepID=A0A5C2HDM6_9BACT|nr:hypothetical protein [Arcobacter porcinus]OCL89458.1 hypothetical protein AAX27_01881 [Aliarcobacter thereius]QEP41056.1 hypothetical protein APORC_1473 [Arcobacter porcinus]
MIDIDKLNIFLMLSSLFIGGLLGGIIYYFIQNIFLIGLKSYINRNVKNFEKALEQSQISVFLKLKKIQDEYNKKFDEISILMQNTETLQKYLNQKVDSFSSTLNSLNIEVKSSSNAKKELEFEIVKLKNIINRLQKKDKYHE